MNRVPAYVITLILGSKWSLGVVQIFFGMVILRKGDSAKASSHYFALFSHSEKLVIYTFMGHYSN